MPIRRQYQIYIERPLQAVFDFVSDPTNHARLCPEGQVEEVLGALTSLSVGNVVPFRSGPWGNITAEVSEKTEPTVFTLRQLEGPFVSWIHRYKLIEFQQGTLLTEQYEYEPKGIGALTDRLSGAKLWDAWVRHRQSETKKILERIGRIKGPGV
jgi:ligand-binding SRPBCC domain-containing protein